MKYLGSGFSHGTQGKSAVWEEGPAVTEKNTPTTEVKLLTTVAGYLSVVTEAEAFPPWTVCQR